MDMKDCEFLAGRYPDQGAKGYLKVYCLERKVRITSRSSATDMGGRKLGPAQKWGQVRIQSR